MNGNFFQSLKKNREYRQVYNGGKSAANKLLVMYVLKNKTSGNRNRIGITVGKKVGKAVRRNRVKRWIKESLRLTLSGNSDPIKPKLGFDIVVVARSAAGSDDMDIWKIQSALNHLFHKLNLLEIQ